MPHYSYEHRFKAGGSKSQEEELEMPCHWGILRDATISFPAGCHGLCHVHIDESKHQIWPTNPAGDYSLDDFTLPINDTYELLRGVRKLYLRGWNEDEKYTHNIKVTFTVQLSGRYTPAEQLVLRLVSVLERILGIK